MLELGGRKAVIFDLDGTLLDTIGWWNAVDIALAKDLGIAEPDAAALHRLRETSLARHRLAPDPYRRYCGDFGAYAGSNLSAAEIHARRYRISRRFLREEVRMREGAAAVLKRLKALGLRLAVATTTKRANVEIYCSEGHPAGRDINIAQTFEFFITAEDVERIKPDPQCYLMALYRLGGAPEEALVVEDTVSGATAARAAGIETIGIYEPYSAQHADEMKRLCCAYFDNYATFAESLP